MPTKNSPPVPDASPEAVTLDESPPSAPSLVYVCWNGRASVDRETATEALAKVQAELERLRYNTSTTDLALAAAKFAQAQAMWQLPEQRPAARVVVDAAMSGLGRSSKGSQELGLTIDAWLHGQARHPAPVVALISEALRKKLKLPEVPGGEKQLVIPHGVAAISRSQWERYERHSGVAAFIASGEISGPEATAERVRTKDQAVLERLIGCCHDPAALAWLREREGARGNSRTRVIAALDKRDSHLKAS